MELVLGMYLLVSYCGERHLYWLPLSRIHHCFAFAERHRSRIGNFCDGKRIIWFIARRFWTLRKSGEGMVAGMSNGLPLQPELPNMFGNGRHLQRWILSSKSRNTMELISAWLSIQSWPWLINAIFRRSRRQQPQQQRQLPLPAIHLARFC